MIVITKIEYKTTDDYQDRIEIFKFQNPEFDINPLGHPEMKIHTEMIKGRRFVNIKGKEICIGMSEEVQELIGLPFEVFENLQSDIENVQAKFDFERRINTKILKQLRIYQHMGIWDRIKNIFK